MVGRWGRWVGLFWELFFVVVVRGVLSALGWLCIEVALPVCLSQVGGGGRASCRVGMEVFCRRAEAFSQLLCGQP